MFADGAKEILSGCSCGAKVFFYIRKNNIETGKKMVSNLSVDDKKHIEEDIGEILSIKQEVGDKPVVLDIEAIRVMQPGTYELDLVHLFKKDPLIIKLEEGKYMIDLSQAFREN